MHTGRIGAPGAVTQLQLLSLLSSVAVIRLKQCMATGLGSNDGKPFLGKGWLLVEHTPAITQQQLTQTSSSLKPAEWKSFL